jgi:hypothetical protein
MEPHSSHDHQSPSNGSGLGTGTGSQAHSGQTVSSHANSSIPNSGRNVGQATPARVAPASVSAALAVANAAAHARAFPVQFPGEDGGRSLAQMAEHDLDAALQLLADRAQYITGANGAAIALRRTGKNDLLCRASAGTNAPELGALLSTEFGLSGESVRTRRPLRCDDAECDARVNREVCRELGIASVVVMPVVDDDQVLGVFELFSGKANAFGERDLSALQRLSEMVETAIRQARAAESVSRGLSAEEYPASEIAAAEVIAAQEPEVEVESEAGLEAAGATESVPGTVASGPNPSTQAAETQTETKKPASIPKPLYWSVALSASGETSGADAGLLPGDQSHVPPVLRNLHKCAACGFPVSDGRTLCVECEEKKWRGQLRARPVSKQSSPAAEPRRESKVEALPATKQANAHRDEPKQVAVLDPPSAGTSEAKPAEPSPARPQTTAEPLPGFVLSAGLEPSQSWFSRNKYVIAAILVAGASVAAVVILH